MIDYKTVSLDIRNDNQVIAYAGKAPKKNSNDWPIAIGNVVTLQKTGVQIIVKVTQQCQNDEWVGNVVGFDNWDGKEYEGINVNDEITFCVNNVFSCAFEAHAV